MTRLGKNFCLLKNRRGKRMQNNAKLAKQPIGKKIVLFHRSLLIGIIREL